MMWSWKFYFTSNVTQCLLFKLPSSPKFNNVLNIRIHKPDSRALSFSCEFHFAIVNLFGNDAMEQAEESKGAAYISIDSGDRKLWAGEREVY